MPSRPSSLAPDSTNMLGDAVNESRQQFRKLLSQLDRLIDEGQLDEARKYQPKLEKLGKEVLRILNPRDSVERKYRAGIQRDLDRVRAALKKGWGGAVGVGLLALVLGSLLGVAVLSGILYFAFIR